MLYTYLLWWGKKRKVRSCTCLINGLLLVYRLCGALLISQKGKFMAKYDISFLLKLEIDCFEK